MPNDCGQRYHISSNMSSRTLTISSFKKLFVQYCLCFLRFQQYHQDWSQENGGNLILVKITISCYFITNHIWCRREVKVQAIKISLQLEMIQIYNLHRNQSTELDMSGLFALVQDSYMLVAGNCNAHHQNLGSQNLKQAGKTFKS